jgi:hypothetical protein
MLTIANLRKVKVECNLQPLDSDIHHLTFSIHIILWRNNILILSPAFRFIPSLIGFGIANPTDVPHLTSLPSNSADIIHFL